MHFEDFIPGDILKWPYTTQYGKENGIESDVLVLGGGIAGCWAAITAARRGARVVLVEKSVTRTSGAGGSGVDHWHAAVTNPACKITPEEFTLANIENFRGWRNGISQYITSRESYDCLLDLEKLGVKIRDSGDEFKGAEFRDDATRLMFAYDYSARYCIRVWGSTAKPALQRECQRLGVEIYNHVMVTGLLNQGGKQGTRVVGATGFNTRTGEFYVFRSKASILCMFLPQRQWIFNTELKGLCTTHRPPNSSGDGHAMAWKAGAEFTAVEHSRRGMGAGYGYPQYGVGNAANTWYACTLVDAEGKQIPWVNRDGTVLKTVSERYQPAPGQKFFISDMSRVYKYQGPTLLPDWQQRARQGEFTLPVYADIPSLPELERKVLWGMMIAQEARTLIPVYWTYNQAGFDPEKDMLQYYDGNWMGMGPPQWRDGADGGGLVVDWDLKTSLDGLYAAGGQLFASGDHAYAAVTGCYAARKAAAYAEGIAQGIIDPSQVEQERARVYAPLKRRGGIDWKELNAGICRVMQDYCGEIKNDELLKIGLKWIEEIEDGEAQTAFARNPHELGRLHEVFNIVTNARMIFEACRAHKASNADIGFIRADYPAADPPEWHKWLTIRLDGDHTSTGSLPPDYWGDLQTNYAEHCGL
ncbi:MAG: FAD-dependent oxidoreductase [Dehalococcoidales bacterium]|nr:FAD-dependent oxidoreductase [Dehalococcoidales bacterium]